MIIFFGPAGAGKSAQGQLLESENNWEWVSMGQLLRDSNDIDLFERMQRGELVDATKTNELIKKSILDLNDYSKIVIDGYPRQMDQAKWLLANQPINGHSVDLGIVFDVPRLELEKRMQSRGRLDDTAEAITERLRIYDDLTIPVLEYFTEKNIKLVHINGVGSINEVHNRIARELELCNLI